MSAVTAAYMASYQKVDNSPTYRSITVIAFNAIVWLPLEDVVLPCSNSFPENRHVKIYI